MKKYILPLFIALAVVACEEDKKDDPTTQEPTTPTAPPAVNPTIPNADAICIALKTASTVSVPFIGQQTTYFGIGIANSLDGSSLGTVTCEGEQLKDNGGGTYTTSFGPGNTEGLTFDRPIEWTLTGGSTVGAVNFDHNVTIPEINGVNGDAGGEVDLSEDFTLSYGNNTDLGSADSLYFVVYDKNSEYVLKRAGRSASSMTFTAAEMAALEAGFGYIQINAFTYELSPSGANGVAFVAQGSNTKQVTLK